MFTIYLRFRTMLMLSILGNYMASVTHPIYYKLHLSVYSLFFVNDFLLFVMFWCFVPLFNKSLTVTTKPFVVSSNFEGCPISINSNIRTRKRCKTQNHTPCRVDSQVGDCRCSFLLLRGFNNK